MIRLALSLAAVAAGSLVLGGDAIAQTIPGGATPGGMLPDVSDNRRDQRRDAGVVVPSVLERYDIEDIDGFRIQVQQFKVYANRRGKTAWQGGDYLPEVQQILTSKLSDQPAEGFTLDDLNDITLDIQNKLRSDGMLLAQVYLPVQTVADGILGIEITEGRLGRVVVSGNKSYNENVLGQPVEPMTGSAVDRDSIEEAILLIRDYPGLRIASVLQPGTDLGTSDLNLTVLDEDKYEFDFSLDNHGSEFTGDQRLTAGVRINNVLGLGDQLRLTGLTTFNPSNSDFLALNYAVPLGSPKTALRLNYLRNEFTVGGSLGGGSIEGDTVIGGLGATHTIKRSRDFNLGFNADVNIKQADISDTTSGLEIGEDRLAVFEAGLFTDFVDQRFRGINSGYISYSRGMPGTFGAVERSEPGVNLGTSRTTESNLSAGGDFDKWYGEFSRLQQITEHTDLLIRVAAQASDDLLVSLEQFALGGPTSVRAFPTAEYLVDTGGFVSMEYVIEAPGFAEKEAFGGRTWGELLRFSVFYDYAGGYVSEAAFGEEKTRDLSGYGIGIDFQLPSGTGFRLDVARPNSSEEPSDGDDTQFYARFNFVL